MIPTKGRNLTRFCVKRVGVLRVCWVRAGHGEGLFCLTDCGFSVFCFCGVSKRIPNVHINTCELREMQDFRAFKGTVTS